jgi:integrase
MLAARVEQKNGTYLNNIQRDRQSSPSPTPVAVFGICPDRHSHRHALACEMLRQGASLPDIGQILRHRSPQTTAIYAKVDLASLRPLALPWPGAMR